MKTLFAAASLMVFTAGSAIASPAGLGGGSHPGNNFGNHVAASVGLTGNRWGPNDTTAYAGPTNRWGPNLVHHKPADFGVANIDQQQIACPCVVTFDPFKPKLGAVPLNLAKELKLGVQDETQNDKLPGSLPIGPLTFSMEVDLMGAVWGAHFDPSAPANEKTDSGQPAQ